MKFYQRRDREFKQTVMKNISKKLEGMMDTTSSKNDTMSAINTSQSLDVSQSDANILKVLTSADGSKKLNTNGTEK
jgi:hypothetical protein